MFYRLLAQRRSGAGSMRGVTRGVVPLLKGPRAKADGTVELGSLLVKSRAPEHPDSRGTVALRSAWRLYLPESWAADGWRRPGARAGAPRGLAFRKKWEIALDAIDVLEPEHLPRAGRAGGQGYREVTEFRDGLTARGFSYAIAVNGDTSVSPPGTGPRTPPPYTEHIPTPMQSSLGARLLDSSTRERTSAAGPGARWRTVP